MQSTVKNKIKTSFCVLLLFGWTEEVATADAIVVVAALVTDLGALKYDGAVRINSKRVCALNQESPIKQKP